MEGGMCVTDDFELFCIMRSLRAHGWTRELPNKNPLIKTNDKKEYNFILPGYNLRPGEIHGSVGIEQLKKLNSLIKYRVKNWLLFQKFFLNDNRFIIQKTKNFNSSFAFTLILKKSDHYLKNKILKSLKKNKIAHRLITGGCFSEHPYAKLFKYRKQGNLPNATKAHRDGFFVGNAGQNLDDKIKFFYQTLKNIK
jgi:CDP-6-deoxy-D-xylo-4-hexulose-3-dehydrase